MSANSASGNFAQTLSPQPFHITTTPLTTHRQHSLRSTPSPPIMPANTRSTKPRNRSGLQRQPAAAEKRKRAESGANKSNKKPKATTNETTDDVDDDLQVTGKGKRAPRGKGKRARCVAPPATSLLLTSFRKTAAKRAQDDAAADAAGPKPISLGMCPPLTPFLVTYALF